jgi:hypothetical protein
MEIERLASRCFGTQDTNDPRLLLGLISGRTDAIAIKKALRRRKAQLYVNPSFDSSDKKAVIEYLELIASELESANSDIGPIENAGDVRLTPLDRAIIATLISEGGWNKKSRARLVAVAASYSITVGGLIRILEAFAESARSGRGPLSSKHRDKHPIESSWVSLPKRKRTISPLEAYIANTTKKLVPDLRSPSPLMTVKLSVLFGLLTILVFVLSFYTLTRQAKVNDIEELVVGPGKVLEPVQNIVSPLYIPFSNYPTFQAGGVKQAILRYADQGVGQLVQLQVIAETFSASVARGETIKQSVFTEWNEAIDVFSYGWPFIDSSTMQLAKTQIVQILLHAESQPAVAARLLDSLLIPNIKLDNPLSILRAVWLANELSTLSCDQRLSSETRAQVRAIQFNEIATCDSYESEVIAMKIIAEDLLGRTEFDNRSLDMWEVWLTIVDKMQTIQISSDLKLFALQSILKSDIDLLRESNTRRVLGRLIADTQWSLYPSARDAICDLVSSGGTDISDLVALTALFNQSTATSWFSDLYVVGQNSTHEERVKIADALRDNWPIDTNEIAAVWNLSIPVGFNLSLVQGWKKSFSTVMTANQDRMLAFVKLRLLNEAAVSIWKGKVDIASKALDASAVFELESERFVESRVVMQDGVFEEVYRGDEIKHAAALNELYGYDATDLGIKDANLLAEVALTNPRRQMREVATIAIIEQFKRGVNVAVALVNNFDKAISKDQINLLVTQLTSIQLPEDFDASWSFVARKALVQHALTIGRIEHSALDLASARITASLISEYKLFNPDAILQSSGMNAQSSLELVVDSWKQAIPTEYRPKNHIAINPLGAMQLYLKLQLEYYSLLQAEESRWRSHKHPVLHNQHLFSRLYEKQTIVDQLFAVEVEIANHWLRLFNEVEAEYERRSGN